MTSFPIFSVPFIYAYINNERPRLLGIMVLRLLNPCVCLDLIHYPQAEDNLKPFFGRTEFKPLRSKQK